MDLGTRVKVFGGGERGDGARTAIYCIVYRLKGSKKEINYKSFCSFIINGSALCNLVLLTFFEFYTCMFSLQREVVKCGNRIWNLIYNFFSPFLSFCSSSVSTRAKLMNLLRTKLRL